MLQRSLAPPDLGSSSIQEPIQLPPVVSRMRTEPDGLFRDVELGPPPAKKGRTTPSEARAPTPSEEAGSSMDAEEEQAPRIVPVKAPPADMPHLGRVTPPEVLAYYANPLPKNPPVKREE